mgnify:CR=1 FL=1
MTIIMNYKHSGLIVLLFFLSFTSCSDFVEGFEESPNQANDAPIEAVLNGALTGLIIGHSGEDARLGAMWARQFTGSDRQYAAFNVYNVNAENFEWDKFYLAVENAEITISKAEEVNDLLASGIAKIIKAHSIGMVASLWGDIPYREANEFPDIEDPVFDPQEQVYGDLQGLLDDAIADLSKNPSSAPIEGIDFYFGGDPAAWTAVAYSLKARFYLHTKQYAEALAAARQGIQQTEGDWMIPHFTGSYNQDMNIYHSFGVADRQGYMTANDAILPAWLDPASDSYRGNAKTDEGARFAHLFVGDGPNWDLNYSEGAMWGATTPFPLFTTVENYLIIAEAELRTNSDMAAALEALNEARAWLAAQFPDGTYEPYVLADFEAGGIAARPGASAMEALLYEIVEEKYVSLVGQIEVYNDLRRTDNLLEIPPVTGSEIPKRFLIPQVEINANTNAPSPIPGLMEATPVNR